MGNDSEKSFDAVRAGDAETLRALLASNPAIAGARNDQGLSLLMQASYFQRKELVQLLLDAAPPIDIFEAATVPGMSGSRSSVARGRSKLGHGLVGGWFHTAPSLRLLRPYRGRRASARSWCRP